MNEVRTCPRYFSIPPMRQAFSCERQEGHSGACGPLGADVLRAPEAGYYECPRCDGTGGVHYTSREAWLAEATLCTNCERGIDDDGGVCRKCDGTRRVQRTDSAKPDVVDVLERARRAIHDEFHSTAIDLIDEVISTVGEPEYLEGGWIRDGVMAVCPECKRVKEGTISWHIEHEAACEWRPAGTWLRKRIERVRREEREACAEHVRQMLPTSPAVDAFDNGWNAACSALLSTRLAPAQRTETAPAPTLGFVSTIDLDKGRLHVTCELPEKELRRLSPLMLQGAVVSVEFPCPAKATNGGGT